MRTGRKESEEEERRRKWEKEEESGRRKKKVGEGKCRLEFAGSEYFGRAFTPLRKKRRRNNKGRGEKRKREIPKRTHSKMLEFCRDTAR
jgi:hypothetical protein